MGVRYEISSREGGTAAKFPVHRVGECGWPCFVHVRLTAEIETVRWWLRPLEESKGSERSRFAAAQCRNKGNNHESEMYRQPE